MKGRGGAGTAITTMSFKGDKNSKKKNVGLPPQTRGALSSIRGHEKKRGGIGCITFVGNYPQGKDQSYGGGRSNFLGRKKPLYV